VLNLHDGSDENGDGVADGNTVALVRTSHNNPTAPSRLYTEYFSGLQYAVAGGPGGWPAGFYRTNCRPDLPESAGCTAGAPHRRPVRPFIFEPDESADRLPEREYYDVGADPFQLTNGFGAGASPSLALRAAAETAMLRCRLNSLAQCAGPACQAAEWATTCSAPAARQTDDRGR